MHGLIHAAVGLIITVFFWHVIPSKEGKPDALFDKEMAFKGHPISPRHFTRVSMKFAVSLLAGTPGLRYFQWAILVEIGLMACFLLAWFLLKRTWKMPEKRFGSRGLTVILAEVVGIAAGTAMSLILIPVYPWW